MTKTKNPPENIESPSKPGDRCSVAKVKPGSVWSRHSFGMAEGSHSPFSFDTRVRNLTGQDWSLPGSLVQAEFSFADQFDIDVSLSRTKIIEIMTRRPWTAMTIKFRKKVDLSDKDTKAKGLALWNVQNLDNDKSRLKALEDFLAGEERTMAGYHMGEVDVHGRLVFMEIVRGDDGAPVEQRRLVDPRTVFDLIVARMHYAVQE